MTDNNRQEFIDIIGDLKADWEAAKIGATPLVRNMLNVCYPIGWHNGLVIAYCDNELLAFSLRKREIQLARRLAVVNPAITELMITSPNVKPAVYEV